MRSNQAYFVMVAVAMAAFTASFASANIVNNSGFETGDFTGWGTQAAPVGSAFEVSTFMPYTGTYSVYLHGTGGQYDEFYQTLSTDPGQEYLVSFWVYNNGVGDDSLRVGWEGNEALLHTPVSTELEMWVQVSTQVVAAGSSAELRLGGYDGISSFFIDDVSVVAVPEPATLGLLAGAGALAIRRRRNRLSH